MNRSAIVAAGFICAWSGAAAASETMGGTGLGKAPTTAAVHCDTLSGAQRDACLREMGERNKRPSTDPPAGVRSKKESARPPVKAAPAESRTAEDATSRAADRKAPSGALIIDTPSGKLPKP